MISIKHPALNMIGPGVARSEETTATLIGTELQRYRGEAVLVLVPMDQCKLVSQMYDWGAGMLKHISARCGENFNLSRE